MSPEAAIIGLVGTLFGGLITVIVATLTALSQRRKVSADAETGFANAAKSISDATVNMQDLYEKAIQYTETRYKWLNERYEESIASQTETIAKLETEIEKRLELEERFEAMQAKNAALEASLANERKERELGNAKNAETIGRLNNELTQAKLQIDDLTARNAASEAELERLRQQQAKG